MPKVVITDAKGLVQETGTGFIVDNNDDGKPAYIALRQADGDVSYLFVDDDGKLRIHTAVPTGPGVGTIVGTQS